MKNNGIELIYLNLNLKLKSKNIYRKKYHIFQTIKRYKKFQKKILFEKIPHYGFINSL